MNNKIICKFCNKEYSIKGIGTHILRKHGDGINHKPRLYITHTALNKGLTKQTDERIKKTGKKLSNKIKRGEIIPHMLGKKHKQQTIKKLKQKCGGIRKGAGRGKSGWYKEYLCDSSWELAYVIYNIEHDIKFERNKIAFEYVYENEIHKYYPDFILENDTYVEVKGFLDNKSKEKIKQFKQNLIIINKNDIKLYLNYVKNKYGNNFIDLYKK